MPDRLFLRLDHAGGLCWLRQPSGARAPAVSVRGDPPASALAAATEIVVFVPASEVLLTEVKLSARNRTQLLQALPFAVEEQLVSPVEELHFAVSTGSTDTLGAAVVAKQTLRGWLDRLAAIGVQADVLVPDSLGLPLVAERTNVMIEDDQATVRLGTWSAFACSLRELPDWLTQVQAVDALAPLIVQDFRAAPALQLPVPVASYQERQRDPLAALAAAYGPAPLNLLDGEFATRHRHARGARGWKIAAMLAAAAVLLGLLNLGLDVLNMSRASTRMDALAQDAVRAAFPDIDAAQLARLSPEQLMRGRLERLRGGAGSSGLLHLLQQIGPVLGSTRRIQTRGMEYRNGTLELALRAPDVGALDGVRERLALLPGLKAEVTAANPGADGVDGRIRIVTTAANGAAR